MKKILFLITGITISQISIANTPSAGALHQDPSLCSYGYNSNCYPSYQSPQPQSEPARTPYQYPYDDYCEARPKGGKICQHNHRGTQYIHHIAEYDAKGNVIYHREYYSDGMTVKFEANYDSKGNRQGISKRYHENGQLEGMGNFINDGIHGEYRNFDKNGRLIRIEHYKNGVFLYATEP